MVRKALGSPYLSGILASDTQIRDARKAKPIVFSPVFIFGGCCLLTCLLEHQFTLLVTEMCCNHTVDCISAWNECVHRAAQ